MQQWQDSEVRQKSQSGPNMTEAVLLWGWRHAGCFLQWCLTPLHPRSGSPRYDVTALKLSIRLALRGNVEMEKKKKLLTGDLCHHGLRDPPVPQEGFDLLLHHAAVPPAKHRAQTLSVKLIRTRSVYMALLQQLTCWALSSGSGLPFVHTLICMSHIQMYRNWSYSQQS